MTAIRLTIDIRDGAAAVRSVTRLTMPVPPEQKIPNMGEGAGAWIELRDGDGSPIYRRLIDDGLLQGDTEVRTGAADRPLVRRKAQDGARSLSVVVPDDPRGTSVVILRRAPGTKRAKEVLSYRLSGK